MKNVLAHDGDTDVKELLANDGDTDEMTKTCWPMMVIMMMTKKKNLLAHDGDTARISAEGRNVSFHPLKTSNLLS